LPHGPSGLCGLFSYHREEEDGSRRIVAKVSERGCPLLRGAAKAARAVLSVKGSGRGFIALVQVITAFCH